MTLLAALAELVTIANVPVVETGIEYPASTGPVTFTEGDLQALVESQQDAAIVAPRIKLGHVDPRFNGVVLDGEPAFGTVQNIRLTNSGHTVLADLVGMPEWLAAILPSAYPSRSIEGNFNVKTTTGHDWQFVMTDLALLGVIWPGITTLDDLQAAYSKEGPQGVSVTITASTNMEDIRRAFYDDVATKDQSRFWWWIRAVLLDPNELIADDDEGGLYRVPFSVNGDTITFEDPVPVKIEYVDAPVAASVLCGAAKTVLATYQNGRDSRPTQRTEERVTLVTASVDLDNLRRVLGLPADASEEQINEAISTRAAQEGPTPTEPGPGVESSPTAPTPDQPPPTQPAPGPAVEPAPEEGQEPEAQASGAVMVDRATLADLQSRANLGAQAFERQRIADRDTQLQAAVNAGKFPPARLTHWQGAWDRDPDGIKAQIDQMPEGLIPVGQRGIAPSEVAANSNSYPSGWLPKRSHGTVTQEG